jgi:hypothetical protein
VNCPSLSSKEMDMKEKLSDVILIAVFIIAVLGLFCFVMKLLEVMGL